MTAKKLIRKIPGFNTMVVPYHRAKAFRAASKYDYPASGMKVIAVTGTNGKTTTSFMIHSLLKEAGKKVGLMTTVAYGINDDLKPQIEHMTTVSAGALNRRIAEMRDACAEYLVLEVTSHALAQYRTFGIPIDVAVMTNVTHEHLDYHKTFKNYVTAKRLLFKNTQHTHKGQHIGIINADDPSAELFAGDIEHPITYGIDNGDLPYFMVFSAWRLAAIVEGAFVLYREGKVDSDYARNLERDVPNLLQEAAALIDRGGA